MITLAWPWIWLLLPLPWLLTAFVQQRNRNNARREVQGGNQAIAIPPQLAAAMDEQVHDSKRRRRWTSLLPWLCWLLLLTALSQPYLVLGSQVQPASGRAIMLVIDLSGSMEKRDFELDGKKSDRLSAVKRVAAQFARQRRGDRLGLVLFADEAFAASPLTFDNEAVAGAIAEAGIGMVGRTTAIGDALGLAMMKLREDPGREKAIVLLSDGTNNSGSAEPEDAAGLAMQFGIRIHTIALTGRVEPGGGVMDPAADLDEETLQKVAQIAGGEFFRATTFAQLDNVYRAIGKLETSATKTPPLAVRHDLRDPFTLALLLTLLAGPVWRRLQGWFQSRVQTQLQRKSSSTRAGKQQRVAAQTCRT